MTPRTWGGPRPGAGRKPRGERCACGAMTLKRALARWHKCGTGTLADLQQEDHKRDGKA